MKLFYKEKSKSQNAATHRIKPPEAKSTWLPLRTKQQIRPKVGKSSTLSLRMHCLLRSTHTNEVHREAIVMLHPIKTRHMLQSNLRGCQHHLLTFISFQTSDFLSSVELKRRSVNKCSFYNDNVNNTKRPSSIFRAKNDLFLTQSYRKK